MTTSHKLKQLFSIVFFLITQLFFAQKSIYFDHITTSNGLSQGDINTIYQDQKGFMWFGTHDGLNKFDGYDFTVYKPDINDKTSINSNLVYSIAGDKHNNIWIGTTGKGVNYYDKVKDEFLHFTHDKNDPNSLRNNHVSCVFIDKEDRLWVGNNKGLDVASIKDFNGSLNFKHFKITGEEIASRSNKNRVHSIFQDSQNQIWVGDTEGLFMMSRDSMDEIYFKHINNMLGLPKAPVNDMIEDKYGRIIIGTGVGAFMYDPNKFDKKVKQIFWGFINSMTIDKKDNLWLGGYGGLFQFKIVNKDESPRFIEKFRYSPEDQNSINNNVISSLFVDKTGIVWIGTQGGGVNKIDHEKKQFQLVKNTIDEKSLSYNTVRTFYEDKNQNLWIGTSGGGINICKKGNDYKEFFKIETSIKKCFSIQGIDNDTKMLLGFESYPGLYELDLKKIKNIENISEKDLVANDVKESVFSMLEDSNKNVWIGTYNGGLYRWLKDKKNNTYKKERLYHEPSDPNSLPSDIIRAIHEDHLGNIWLGTANGLSKLVVSEIDKNSPKFINYYHNPSNEKSISHNYILQVKQTKDKSLWIGTLGGGINKLTTAIDQNKASFIHFSEKDGLSNNVIKGFLEDDEGNLWISSNKGISKFDLNNKTFKNYDQNDGLQGNEFVETSSIKRKNGELLFGGTNGFNVFRPKKIKDNPHKANAVITKFSIDNQPIKRGDKFNNRVIFDKAIYETKELELKYDENSISFEFAALHYSVPSKNKFAYKLEGFDKSWIYTNAKKRFANYTNLSPGNYTLKVKAANNDNIWEENYTEMAIKIVPPFWKTTQAYVIYSIAFILLLILFWKYILNKAKNKHQLEVKELEKEKKEELQNLKLEFFTNVSHEFRTPLTLIKGPLDVLQKRGLELKPDAFKEQLRLMEKNTNYLLRLVNQLLDFRKMNQGKTTLVMRNSNIVSFIKEVAEPFQFLVHKKEINFTINNSSNSIYSWFDHDAIEKIINNLLSNAYKFTPKEGTIEVSVSENENKVVIQVKDSGIGIAPDRMKNIFERYYTKKDKNENNPKGIGIGLAFTKNLVELHQGTIEVKSEPNQGTEFTIQLPIEKEAYLNIPEIVCKEDSDGDYARRSSESESIAIDMNDDIADESIAKQRSNELPILLIVDDNKDIRSFIRYSLEDEYKIYEAENGKEGFEIATKIIPNVIITDLVMHIMDGIELCEKLKTTVTTSHIPVLILSAKLSQEKELESLQHGADDYIRKPFDIELLNLKLKNITKKRALLRKRFNREVDLQPEEVTVTSADERFLKQVIEIIDKHMTNTEFSVETLVNEIGQSRSNLYLKLKEITGLSSSEFIRSIRLKRAMQLFDTTDLPVKEVMYKTGFSTASYFSKCFKKQFGAKPSDYLNKKKGNSGNISVDDLLDK
ncbi:hybrid sensor histidine kinase/response regulator transcription factor [Ochrovirga pacifica]|uniref:hybrid sensor histidine kinase/response regulator transcription factor n=1 Tax=Ochrovirga pacifica TaxID=1042376 RepID=UPI0002557B97|nr:two-component regulator propeller domain-containing protein [Ochrovirga pacifica]